MSATKLGDAAAAIAPMERLADEIIQLVFEELDDPGSFSMVSRRLHAFSQAAYVRARYFLVHYGSEQAFFYALGRGKVLTEQVIDVLLSSGARLSRYLVQVAMHHYFHTQAHFIRTPWVRTIPLSVFLHFMQVSQARYGDIPRGKGEDDGSLFMTFLKESRFPSHLKTVTWENIMEILEKYKFMPFSIKDPIMAQFPLILAIEPRLLPAAVANGFRMDYKYRDFVFRKMFERHTGEAQASDVAQNIRELCKLDPTMFVSRTVAGEVCMEAKYNDVGYTALKQLDKSGHLRFDLRTLVADLLKTFLTTRAISHTGTGDILRQLFSDYPSTDPAVRLVVITSIFITAESTRSNAQQIQSNLEATGLTPLTRRDLYHVLINPFVDKYSAVIEYATGGHGVKDVGGEREMSGPQVDSLIQEAASKSLEIGCKGKFLNRVLDGFPWARDALADEVCERHSTCLQGVPSWDDGDTSGFTVPLSFDYTRRGLGDTWEQLMDSINAENVPMASDVEHDGSASESPEHSVDIGQFQNPSTSHFELSTFDLGNITQESLTNMIRQDELAPTRSRRRWLYTFSCPDSSKLNYPHDALPVAKWALNQFGARSKVTASFMTHAVINENSQVLGTYLMKMNEPSFAPFDIRSQVPVTLKHFQILARLGRAPTYHLYHCIENGAEFHLDEDSYTSTSDPASGSTDPRAVKIEPLSQTLPSSFQLSSRDPSRPSSSRGQKRPRRTATASVRSYALPDSDDDVTLGFSSGLVSCRKGRKPREQSSLQKWIFHLTELQKQELKRHKDYQKRSPPGCRLYTRRTKSAFLKSLTSHLRILRRQEADARAKQGLLPDADVVEPEYDDEDAEYILPAPKRRKVHPL